MSTSQIIMTHDALDALDAPALVIGEGGAILDANRAALDCYGHSLVEMLRLSIHDLRAPGDQADIDVQMRSAAKTGALFETVHLSSEGSPFPAEIRSVPVLLGGMPALLGFVRDITMDKRSEQELKDSESRYRALAESSPLAVFVFRNERENDTVVLANPACVQLFRASSSDELIGKSTTELFDPDSRMFIREHLREAGERVSLAEAQIIRLDGTRVAVEVTGSALQDQGVAAVQIVLRDITERKQAEDDLRHAHQLFRATFEHAGVGIAHVRLDGTWLSVNRSLCDLLGYSAEELLHTTFSGIAHPDDAFYGARLFQTLVTGEDDSYTAEKRYVRKDGSVVWAELNVAAIRAEIGVSDYFVCVFTDITRRKADEEQLARQLERIESTLTSVIDIATSIAEARDPYTAGHQRRVSELAVRIAQDMGLSRDDTESIRVAALLHDIGKVNVPVEILTKSGALSQVEHALVEIHCEAGFHIITSAHMEEPIAELVYEHHERCDGSGYPRGLRGDQMLAGAKVIAVAEVVETMVTYRLYRPALGVEAALAEIEAGAGGLYDEDAVRSCARLFREEGFAFSESSFQPVP